MTTAVNEIIKADEEEIAAGCAGQRVGLFVVDYSERPVLRMQVRLRLSSHTDARPVGSFKRR